MHRLQYLHLELARLRSGPLHAKPHHRRGMAARLASGARRRPRAALLGALVGAGPAGLECALTLGRRGYEVMLAEAER